MLKQSFVTAGAVIALGSSYASAAALLYEPFDYDGTGFPALSTHVDTYVTPTQTWTKGGTTIEPQVSDAGSLSYSGLPASIGNSAFTSGAGNASNSSLSRLPIGSDLTAAYYSMIIRVPTGVASTGANGVNGSFLAGLQYLTSTATSGCAAALCIRPGGGINGASTFNLGIAFRDTATRQFDSTLFNPGDTIFVVVKYNSNLSTAGLDSKDDDAQLFIFGNAGTAPASEPGAASVASTNAGSATNDYFYTQGTNTRVDTAFRTMFLRNNTSEPTTIQIDEIRLGSTWADVVPVPEPIGMTSIAGFGVLALARRRR